MTMDNPSPTPKKLFRGFVIGELLVAAILLAVTVSSLAALMYSVTRHPRPKVAEECVGAAAKSAKCVKPAKLAASAKLLSSSCARGAASAGCRDTIRAAPGETVLRTRTDSASQALVRKRPAPKAAARPDLGFIR